jgi:ADP-ribose pyrophosphatase
LETWIDSKTVYEGRIVNLKIGNVRLDDGSVAFREVVQHPGGVTLVPYHNGKVVFVHQYRIAIGRDMLELPAGKLEGGEDPVERARAELKEETGYTAGRIVPVGSIFSSVGYTSEEIHLFLALDLEKGGQALEEDERIEVVEMPLDEICAQIESGEYQDAKSIAGIWRLKAWIESGN